MGHGPTLTTASSQVKKLLDFEQNVSACVCARKRGQRSPRLFEATVKTSVRQAWGEEKKTTRKSYCGHLYKCISVPEEGGRQRTINNICLAFLCRNSKKGNIYDVCAFLLCSGRHQQDTQPGRAFSSSARLPFLISTSATIKKKQAVSLPPLRFAC